MEPSHYAFLSLNFVSSSALSFSKSLRFFRNHGQMEYFPNLCIPKKLLLDLKHKQYLYSVQKWILKQFSYSVLLVVGLDSSDVACTDFVFLVYFTRLSQPPIFRNYTKLWRCLFIIEFSLLLHIYSLLHSGHGSQIALGKHFSLYYFPTDCFISVGSIYSSWYPKDMDKEIQSPGLILHLPNIYFHSYHIFTSIVPK